MSAGSRQVSGRGRALRAGGWVAGGHFAAQLLRLVSNLIMTRLLAPEMFGVMAVAYLALNGFTMLSDMGLRQIVVQSRKGEDADFLNAVWTLQLLRGLAIFVFACLLALALAWTGWQGWLPAGSVYSEPVLPWLIAVTALVAVVDGFATTNVASANRAMTMGQVVRIEVVSQLIAILVMIAWATQQAEVWALVAGSLAAALAKCLLGWRLLPGIRNRFNFEREQLAEVFHFGKWVFLSSTFAFLAQAGDRLVLAALVSPTWLGLYAIAYVLYDALQVLLSRLINVVGLPVLSEIQRDDPERLRAAYYRLRAPLDAVTLGGAGLLFSLGDALVIVLYDERYRLAGPILQVIGLRLVMVRYRLAGQCAIALGRPRALVAINAAVAAGVYLLIPLLFFLHGERGALWAIVVSAFCGLPLYLRFKMRYRLIDWRREFLYLLWLPAGIGAGAVIARLSQDLVARF